MSMSHSPGFAVDLPGISAVPIVGSEDLFPVRRIYCVGRNYADHAREMGIDPRTEEPFFFLKPTDTVLAPVSGEAIEVAYPSNTANLHHEVELVVAIGLGGINIAVEDAARHIFGYAVGVDMTRRDRQLEMRGSGKPWEIGKTFERCAPIGPLTPIARCGEMLRGPIKLRVNLETRQSSDVSSMIWSVNEIIAKLSQSFTLRAGDLIFTGTPEGVNAVVAGDLLSAEIEGLSRLQVAITQPVAEGDGG